MYLKTEQEIAAMVEGGSRLHRVVDELMPQIKEGMTTLEVDQLAEQLIVAAGGFPSFKKVKGYKYSTCLPLNEQVVHTLPSTRVLKAGDVLTVDIGMYYEGLHTDYATTVVIGGVTDPKVAEFLKVGQETLDKAIAAVQAGHYLGEVSQVIQDGIYDHGYKILRDLTGHGVGKELHEEPYVPGFLDRPVEKTMKMKPGLVIAVEVIYAMSTEKIKQDGKDGWSIKTADDSLSACFEHTVAITSKNTCILT